MPQVTDWFAEAARAATVLAERSGVDGHDVVVVLGSGWKAGADRLGEVVFEASTTELAGFPPSTVVGHAGTVRSVRTPSGRHVLVFVGRVHGYEGHEPGAVVHAVRVAWAAGCRVAVLTNAAGAVRADLTVGQPVLISDHVNLTGRSSVGGLLPETVPSRFVDLTDAYASRLRDMARSVDPGLPEGVYAGLGGPHYETPAEIRMLRTLGADLVGMSTVWETIAARHLGMEVLGLSLVTNLAAGVAPEPLSHEEVLAAGRAAEGPMAGLLAGVVARLL